MVDKPIFEFGEEQGIPVNVSPPYDKTLGLFLCAGPTKAPGEEKDNNHIISLNFTGKPGTAASLYYSLVFQLPKWEFNVSKADEWIEVSPTHKEYYDRTVATKQMLEGAIKTGLTSAAAAVSDFELMNHDLRRYREILNYFAAKDEHSLKVMFIDYVDVHTDLPGQPISLRTSAARWPTIIADFIKLKDEDLDPDQIAKKLNISKAEAVILTTKNKLYKQWKELFGKTAKDRYGLLKGLVEGRKKTIKEYREWLKPYLARFKMTKIGGERPAVRAGTLKSFADITGVATFWNGIKIFAWKPLKTKEARKPAAEMKSFVINPYDSFIRENYILDPVKGLASVYPWLRNDRKYCSKCKTYHPSDAVQCEKCGSTRLIDKKLADEIVEKEILKDWEDKRMSLDPAELYYIFLDIDIIRAGTRLPTGELEDIIFVVRDYVLSQNALLVKLLELKCRDRELEKYIDEILGVKIEEKEMEEIVRGEFPSLFPKKELNPLIAFFKGVRDSTMVYLDFFKKIRLPRPGLMFLKPGPYEKNFKDRITKNYLSVSKGEFDTVIKFLREKMGVE